MVDFRCAKRGMKAKIVDEWGPRCNQNYAGRMDKYLGRTVTIREVYSNAVRIEEDVSDNSGAGWWWNKNCFDYLIDPDEEDSQDIEIPDDQFSAILFAGKT